MKKVTTLGGLAAPCGGAYRTTLAAAGASTPSISVSSFNNSFSAMKTLKPLAAEGKGKVAAILPDTVSSTRYVEFDAPDIQRRSSPAACRRRTSPSRTRWAVMPRS